MAKLARLQFQYFPFLFYPNFYDVDIKTLEKKENSVELTFEHGKFPRKKELIIIKPELLKFGKK